MESDAFLMFTKKSKQLKDLKNRFTYHAPKNGQPVKYNKLRRWAFEFALQVDEMVPDGREKALALTKIEEACMWANAGIARGK